MDPFCPACESAVKHDSSFCHDYGTVLVPNEIKQGKEYIATTPLLVAHLPFTQSIQFLVLLFLLSTNRQPLSWSR